MAVFKIAFDNVLRNEGGYVGNSSDLGGTTNHGISLRFLKTINTEANKETVLKLTKDEAEDIYFQYFWIPNNYQDIDSQKIANKVFDTSVNVGNKVGNSFLQEAINFHCGDLKVDGIVAGQTLAKINKLSKTKEAEILLYKLLQKEYYGRLVAKRPEQIIFFGGWLKRADR